MLFNKNKTLNLKTSEIKFDSKKDEIFGDNINNDSEIIEKRQNMLEVLEDTTYISNEIGKEMNSNFESIQRTQNNLNELEHKLSRSEYLVKRFKSIFSYFIPLKEDTEFVNTEENKKITKFIPINEEKNKKNDNILNDNIFYDNAYKMVDDLHKNTLVYTKILKEQNKELDVINERIDQADARIKKTTNTVNLIK